MRRLLARVLVEFGLLPLVAFALLAGSVVFLMLSVKPLEAQVQRLEREISGAQHRPLAGVSRASVGTSEDRLAAFYSHLERSEDAIDWLAKLHGIAKAQGLYSSAGDYRLEESKHRLERYRITLPLSGTYSQIRAFLVIALAECPVLAIDQVSFRRRAASEPRVDADVALTLYLRRAANE